MARKKKELHKIEGDPWSLADTPWGQEAHHFSRESGEPFEKCRDLVILQYLSDGDTRPLLALIRTGQAPGPGVLRYVAAMMGEVRHNKLENLPFRLEVKGNDGNKPRDGELRWRDYLLNKNVECEMEEGGKYEHHAIPNIASLSGLGKQTVRDAYDKFHPRKKHKGRKSKK